MFSMLGTTVVNVEQAELSNTVNFRRMKSWSMKLFLLIIERKVKHNFIKGYNVKRLSNSTNIWFDWIYYFSSLCRKLFFEISFENSL